MKRRKLSKTPGRNSRWGGKKPSSVVLWKPSKVTVLRTECISCCPQIKVKMRTYLWIQKQVGPCDLGKSHLSGTGKAPKEQV